MVHLGNVRNVRLLGQCVNVKCISWRSRSTYRVASLWSLPRSFSSSPNKQKMRLSASHLKLSYWSPQITLIWYIHLCYILYIRPAIEKKTTSPMYLVSIWSAARPTTRFGTPDAHSRDVWQRPRLRKVCVNSQTSLRIIIRVR